VDKFNSSVLMFVKYGCIHGAKVGLGLGGPAGGILGPVLYGGGAAVVLGVVKVCEISYEQLSKE
jgi:hypothetical protein